MQQLLADAVSEARQMFWRPAADKEFHCHPFSPKTRIALGLGCSKAGEHDFLTFVTSSLCWLFSERTASFSGQVCMKACRQ